MSKYIIALDQGTTSSRAIVFDDDLNIVSVAQNEFRQIYPQSGWVEHDPMEIYATQYGVMMEAVAKSGVDAHDIAAIGITNQRETTIMWDKNTGRPVYNAIVWQCRRTASFCDQLRNEELVDTIRDKTGLVIDPYFSATKIRWILENVPGAKEQADRGELLFGTVETWLIWKLTGGRVHATDYTNASRTMLYNIKELKWDKELLEIFNIPEKILPEVKPSSSLFGYTDEKILGAKIAIGGVAGDQQAALFGQCCFDVGELKNTYGTGAFLLMNTGNDPHITSDGLLTTIAWGINDKVTYALEGSVFTCGAAIQWLRDGLEIIESAQDSEYYASKVKDSGGVMVVPAFQGLGAPWWDPYARGIIIGITRATTKNHVIRATLESIAYQTSDVISLMEEQTGLRVKSLKVDGGASSNNLLLKFQSNILGISIERPVCVETTALGAAYLCGLALGVYQSVDEIKANRKIDKTFTPEETNAWREENLNRWRKAIKRSLSWHD